MRAIAPLLLAACCCLPLALHAQSGGARKAQEKSSSYGGGGIRGVSDSLPDGWLVDAQEARDFQGAVGFDDPFPLRPRAVMPLIEILRPLPAPDLKVKAPFAIVVQFKAQTDAAIDPSTFKVLYGALKVDITPRITKFVTVTPAGFSLDDARIPQGKHRLTLQVQDDKQRIAERELRFEVE
jgi:hypothetical protein